MTYSHCLVLRKSKTSILDLGPAWGAQLTHGWGEGSAMTSVLRLVWGAGDLLVRASGEGRQKNRQCLARAKSRSLSLRRRQCVRVVQLYQDDFHCQVPRGSPTVWKAKQMTVVVAIRVRQLSVSHSKATSILPLTETLPQCSKWAHCDAGGVCAKKKKTTTWWRAVTPPGHHYLCCLHTCVLWSLITSENDLLTLVTIYHTEQCICQQENPVGQSII